MSETYELTLTRDELQILIDLVNDQVVTEEYDRLHVKLHQAVVKS